MTAAEAVEYVQLKMSKATSVSRDLMAMRALLIELHNQQTLAEELPHYKQFVEDADKHFEKEYDMEKHTWRALKLSLKENLEPSGNFSRTCGKGSRKKKSS